MATISKIASAIKASETVIGVSDRPAPQAEVATATRTSQEAPPALKGVREVVNKQDSNKLNSGSIAKIDLQELARGLQEALDRASKEQYEVGIHEDHATGTQVIEIKDKEGRLVKQFPAEKVLNLQRKLDELSGMVIDEMI